MVKIYPHAKNEVPMWSGSKVIVWTDRHTDTPMDKQTDRRTDGQTDRRTDRHDRKHYLPAFAGGNEVVGDRTCFVWWALNSWNSCLIRKVFWLGMKCAAPLVMPTCLTPSHGTSWSSFTNPGVRLSKGNTFTLEFFRNAYFCLFFRPVKS